MMITKTDREAADRIIIAIESGGPIDIAELFASHREQATAELERALERTASALGMFVMLIGAKHPGMGARIDAMLGDAAIQEVLSAANEARSTLTKATPNE